jgi:hypothetical protein
MTKRLKFTTSLMLGVLAIGFAWRLLRVAEPRYHGRSLAGWLQEYNRVGGMDKTAAASEAIRAMGDRTLPYLLSSLKEEDSPSKLKLLVLARRWHVHLLPPPRAQPPEVAPALLALKALGQTASPAIPELVRMFENPKTSRQGGLGLFSIGPASIPAFEQACGNTNAGVRIEAAWFLGLLPSSYNDDQDYYCTWYRFDKWSKPQAYVTKPPCSDLAERLAWRTKNHPSANVRRACVEALASYYPTSQNDQPQIAIHTLRKARRDPEALVRDSAEAALQKLGIAEETSAETK